MRIIVKVDMKVETSLINLWLSSKKIFIYIVDFETNSSILIT